jgi:hypothetical protein
MSLPVAPAPHASTVVGSASAPPVAADAEPVRADRPDDDRSETDPAAVTSSSTT